MERPPAAIEIRGAATGLLDDPLLLGARGAGEASAGSLLWRARLRDDDGRVWQASAGAAEQMAGAWAPAKATTGQLAALQSLRPVSLDVRVEAPDGRSATRSFVRVLVGEGVRIRRWREPALLATLHLPADAACAAVVIDATAGPQPAAVAALAAPLLASRGALALVVPPPREKAQATEALRLAVERLAAVPGAPQDVVVLQTLTPGTTPDSDSVGDAAAGTHREAGQPPTGAHRAPTSGGDAVVLPPGIPARDADVSARAASWDALLARLGAQPRALR